MKVLIPMSGSDAAFREAGYPRCKSLIEINGKAIIQHIYENLISLRPDQFIFAIRKEDHAQHHLSEVLGLLAPGCRVLVTEGNTAGAACTALLAVGAIGNDEELVISNADQIIRADLFSIVDGFRKQGLDGGTIVFDSIHPRWSYVRINDARMVTEAAEKRPISRHATAGFYYFRRGGDFATAAMNMIRKAAHVNNVYYVCPAFNEMILRQARIGVCEIKPEQYFSLATPQDVQRYEERLSRMTPEVLHA